MTGFQFGLSPVTTIHANINLNINAGSVMSSTSTTTFNAPQQPFPSDSFPGHNQMQDVSMERVEVKDVPPALPVAEPSIELSDEQKNILELVKSGRNIFFTGPAGTGKSVLLRAIIHYLRSVYGGNIGITAPTGIAGLNIGGQTIHSWAGVGFGKEPLEKLKFRINGDALKRWIEAKALIIDEVSMLDGRLFDKLEAIARFVREDSRPFGGIQLIASGDFFQLPPVPEQDSTSKIDATFAFHARSWRQCIERKVKLSKVFRQKDNMFIEMLASMRTGVLADWHKEEFQKLCRKIDYDDGISPTLLFPLKSEVEKHNFACLSKLAGETVMYKAMDARGRDMYDDLLTVNQAAKLLEKLVCPKEVPLRLGAQVMLLRNMLQGVLVNGSLGKVVEFIGVHEAQTRYIQMAELERRKEGQAAPIVNSPDAKEGERGLIALDGHTFKKDQLWPLVKFTNGKLLLCSPVEFTVEGLKGNLEARRLQIPLALSWAMSIHKSQGQTLSRVKVDLGRIFEKGQAYVAISRATGMEGLEIVNFAPEKVMAHPDVIEWQKEWDKDEYQEEEMDSDWAVSQWHDSFHE
jgi:ATP-dependent DNA helicase PIF1